VVVLQLLPWSLWCVRFIINFSACVSFDYVCMNLSWSWWCTMWTSHGGELYVHLCLWFMTTTFELCIAFDTAWFDNVICVYAYGLMIILYLWDYI
jgi:hypothetical protein